MTSEEEIHNFRLAVKNLRTILDLAEFISRRKLGTKQLRAALVPLFDAAGGVRTAQMNLGLLRREPVQVIAACEGALAGDEERSRSELASLRAGFDRERFGRLAAAAGAAIGGLETARVGVFAEQFLLARYRTAIRILKRVKTPRDLHEIRKNIKSGRNTLRVISSCGIRRRSGIEERIVRSVDQALGRWHDETVFRARMRRLAAAAAASGAWWRVRYPAAGTTVAERERRASLIRDTRRRMAALRRALKLA